MSLQSFIALHEQMCTKQNMQTVCERNFSWLSLFLKQALSADNELQIYCNRRNETTNQTRSILHKRGRNSDAWAWACVMWISPEREERMEQRRLAGWEAINPFGCASVNVELTVGPLSRQNECATSLIVDAKARKANASRRIAFLSVGIGKFGRHCRHNVISHWAVWTCVV